MAISRKKLEETKIAFVFLAPFLLVYTVFLLYPVIYSLFLSFHKVTIFSNLYDVFSDMKFVGLSNFTNLLVDSDFWWSLFMTLYYAILTIPLSIGLSLFLAILLNNNLPGKMFFRSAYFLPNVLDMLVVGVIWTLIYSPQFGVLNILLNKIGIFYFSDTGFLSNPYTAMPCIALAMVLKGAGFGMILFLAAIQNIDKSLYEAADIDGATSFEQFRYITVPLVKPVILFLVVTGIMASLNAFTEIYAMTAGGPNVVVFGNSFSATKITGYYLFQKFQFGEYGYAAAMSYLLLFVGLLFSYVNFKFLKNEH